MDGKRLAWALLLTPLLALPGLAQIVEVEVRAEKAVRAQRPYLIERGGRTFLLGEPRWALERDEAGQPVFPAEGFFELDLFVADPEHPEEVPYVWKGERREARWGTREAALPREVLVGIRVLTASLTLETLAADVRARQARIAALERRRAGLPRGSEAWHDAHYLVLDLHRRLQLVLERHGFAAAARALDAEVAKLAKEAGRDPRWARGADARSEFRRLDPPERLVEVAAALSGPTFTLYESRHLRLVSDGRTDAAEARALLALGEEIIEGFRREHVDPTPLPDRIPERVFVEYWFGPDDDASFVRYYEDYYGLSFGTPEQKEAQRGGRGRYDLLGTPRVALAYYRLGHFDEPRRFFVHRLGDVLAGVHYSDWLGDGHLPRLAWLTEAGGIETAFEFLGLLGEPCISRRLDSSGKAEARPRAWNEHPRAHQLALARACPKPLGQLLQRDLLELGHADLAKGWSLYRFLLEDGARGMGLLTAAGRLARDPATFEHSFAAEVARTYGFRAEDEPLAQLERRWLAWLPEE
jgi:hypothetical protein